MSTRSPKSSILDLTLLLVAAGILGLVWTRQASPSAALDPVVRTLAERAAVQDRLTGSALPSDLTRELAGEAPLDELFLWFLDADRCAQCAGDLGDWNVLASSRPSSAHLFLVGDPDSQLQGRLRALGSTRVHRVEAAFVTSLLGYTLPSTRLVVTPDGTIILADSRDGSQDCGWSFDAQVAVLRGLAPPGRIRTVASAAAERPDPTLQTGAHP